MSPKESPVTMTLWLCSCVALGKRHGYSTAFPRHAQEIPKNSPDGYIALCGVVLPPILGSGSITGDEIEAFYALPKCKTCENLTPIKDLPER